MGQIDWLDLMASLLFSLWLPSHYFSPAQVHLSFPERTSFPVMVSSSKDQQALGDLVVLA
jgi:hypothetical protein